MKILVGMSGGVDSTATAYILKKQGHDVIGVNFQFVDAKESYELEDIAKKIDIKIITKNYVNEFYQKIISKFVEDYKNGLTPNPCALCNGVMKFVKLYDLMESENADMIATGHYANICCSNNRYFIKKSKNINKDQSYMLYRLSQKILSHTIFPIGNFDKQKVREVVSEILPFVADKKDSQDVCFIQKGKSYTEFIKEFDFGRNYKYDIAKGLLKETDILSKKYLMHGEFVDNSGNVIGFHDGIINYTIGQRKGLNKAFGERKYVKNIDVENNRVVLCNNDELYANDFTIHDIVFSGLSNEVVLQNINKNFLYVAKLRYRHEGVCCSINFDVDELGNLTGICHSDTPIRAITRGQSAVFYDDDSIMFGGIIV